MRGRKPKAVAGMPKLPKLPKTAAVTTRRRRPTPGTTPAAIPADMGLLRRTPFRGIR